jgi:hypothetical protein
MEKTLEVLNAMEREGLLTRYAIGGAIGAAFYIQPLITDDLDVFIVLPQARSGLLTLSPLYDALRARGYKEDGAYIKVEGVPVQFLPAYNPLVEEALADARETVFNSTPTRVLRAEHLAAIALQTGREKDRARFNLLLQETSFDEPRLKAVVERYRLQDRFREWSK